MMDVVMGKRKMVRVHKGQWWKELDGWRTGRSSCVPSSGKSVSELWELLSWMPLGCRGVQTIQLDEIVDR